MGLITFRYFSSFQDTVVVMWQFYDVITKKFQKLYLFNDWMLICFPRQERVC